MKNDSCTRGVIVLEAHDRHQVYEESIAPLPELRVSVDENPIKKHSKKNVLSIHCLVCMETIILQLLTLCHQLEPRGSCHQLVAYRGDRTSDPGTTTV